MESSPDSSPGTGLRKGQPLLAPLPRLHRTVVLTIVLLAAIGGGVLLSYSVPALPLPVGGLLLGAGVAALVGFLLLHDFHEGVQPARVRRDL